MLGTDSFTSGLIRLFVYSAATLLLLTAIAKLVSATGHSRILQTSDPVLQLPMRPFLWGLGCLELTIAIFCFVAKRTTLQLGLLAWLATNFLFYRLGLWWIDYKGMCLCMGSVTASLGINSETADRAMKCVMIYLLSGSYGSLLWLLWKRRRDSGQNMSN